jgi:hypothetical protein
MLSFPEVVAILLLRHEVLLGMSAPRGELATRFHLPDGYHQGIHTHDRDLRGFRWDRSLQLLPKDCHVRSVTRGIVKLEPFGNPTSYT